MVGRVRLLIGSVACCLPLALAACGDDDATPAVTHLYFSQDGNANGLYELDVTTGAAALVGSGETGTTSSTIGLTETQAPAQLIGSIWNGIALIAADGSDATVLAGSVGVEALAMNTTTGILYGGINGQFLTIDPATGVSTGNLAAPGTDIEGLAANPLGDLLYGLSRSDMNLYVYNIATDTWGVIGSTGQSWLDAGLAYDHLANVLYAIDATTDALYRIHPTTAVATLIGPLGTEAAGGLAFVVE